MTDLSIVLPCYNEAGNLAGLLQRYQRVAQAVAIELILVDNGSTDETPAVLGPLLAKSENSFARSIRVPVNKGYGYGLQSGLAVCQSAVVAFSHADLQCAPEDLQTALTLYQEQKDRAQCLIKGRRRGRRPWPDRIVTWSYNHLASLLLGIQAHRKAVDINAEPKLFSRELVPALMKGPAGFAFDLYVLALARARGLVIHEFEVAYAARVWGKSKLAANPWMRAQTALRSFRYIIEWRMKGLSS
jgi:glycosyltransferase involved in cell wall biosynthesis